ncbi:MAG: hypothetical protein HW416_551 [Chloroflexi bacterium]|nr:hypothetical protein [Chloroflexota bacterium]
MRVSPDGTTIMGARHGDRMIGSVSRSLRRPAVAIAVILGIAMLPLTLRHVQAHALIERTALISLVGEWEPTAEPPPPTEEAVPELPAARYRPDRGPVTTDFEMIASGFTPGEQVVEVFVTPGGRRDSSTHVANAEGAVRFIVEMDPTSPPGAYVSNFTGTSSGVQLSTSFTVTR